MGAAITAAVSQYAADVGDGSFPTRAESFSMNEAVLKSLYGPDHPD
jgi:ketopantoate hydroxymethyltransferase